MGQGRAGAAGDGLGVDGEVAGFRPVQAVAARLGIGDVPGDEIATHPVSGRRREVR
ncbi:hypothetical protein [Nocardioides sp. B-3]|uniref:hypothetical protein n=1 Tax=Nocardioides sp. B-3 TaxID=2895565 RepID=UPI002152C39A|nr:hypothetical protein [Nocardioides sp. B-3]UUZ57897.1 hypothetical protein LP418_16170 [Nocardioides sp. B-3]